jgi:hypothetical protein
MKRIIFLSILSLSFVSLSAQQVWEGTGVAGRYGDFPYTGYYGYSNIFPRNSLVNVQNIANGKIVQIIISGALEDPALFLVLSRQAADALGMDRSDTAGVRVSLAATAADPIVRGYSDLPYSNDPEVNPAARAGDVNSGVEKNPLPPEKIPAVTEKTETKTGAAALGTEAAATKDRAEKEESPSISSRVPAAREDIEIKESPFAELPEERPNLSGRTGADDPGIGENWVLEDLEGAKRPADSAAAVGELPVPPSDVPAESSPKTAEAEKTETTPEAGTKTETIITLEPAEPKPPTEEAGASSKALDSIIASIPETPADPAASSEWARENLPLVTSLPVKSYYLQVASYRNPARVKPLVNSLAAAYPVYPVVVLDTSDAHPFYRVMVGPLGEDERGLILHQIRAKGYKDAFLKENK